MKYLLRNTKNLIIFYYIFNISYSIYTKNVAPIFFLFAMTLILYFSYVEKKFYISKNKKSKNKNIERELSFKIKAGFIFATILVSLITIKFSLIYGFILILITFINNYFYLRESRNESIKYYNFVEVLFNQTIINQISLNFAILSIDILSTLYSSFRLSIANIIIMYIIPTALIFFVSRTFFKHKIYSSKINKKILSKLTTNVIKKTTAFIIILFLCYIIGSSIIYTSFLKRYNSYYEDLDLTSINTTLDNEDQIKIINSIIERIKSDEIFELTINYNNQESKIKDIEQVQCNLKNVGFKFKKILDDTFIKEIYCIYSRAIYYIVDNDIKYIEYKSENEKITNYYDKLVNKIKKTTKVYYINKAYINFINSLN